MPPLVVLLAATMVMIPVAWQAGELDDTHLLQMAMICTSSAVLVLTLGLMLWWLALLRFSWRLRWIVALVFVLLGVAASPPARLVRWQSPSFTRGSILYPRVEFFWKPSADQRAEDDHAAQAKDPSPLPAIDLTIAPTDFPRYRGRHADGVADGSKLADDWSTPPNIRWKRPLTRSYSGFAVAGNVAITLEQRGQNEVVACYDRNTGRHAGRFPTLRITTIPWARDRGPRRPLTATTSSASEPTAISFVSMAALARCVGMSTC